jgi:hypothetical protein
MQKPSNTALIIFHRFAKSGSVVAFLDRNEVWVPDFKPFFA